MPKSLQLPLGPLLFYTHALSGIGSGVYVQQGALVSTVLVVPVTRGGQRQVPFCRSAYIFTRIGAAGFVGCRTTSGLETLAQQPVKVSDIGRDAVLRFSTKIEFACVASPFGGGVEGF